MNLRILTLAVALTVFGASASHARIAESTDAQSLAARAETKAKTITDVDAVLDEIDASLQLARDGGYGRMKPGAMSRLEGAQRTAKTLLAGRSSAMELPVEQQIELYNALEVITATLRNDNKNRMVCTREVSLGSRLPTTECLTVAQREQRARVARDSTDRVLRNACFEGNEGSSPCVKQ